MVQLIEIEVHNIDNDLTFLLYENESGQDSVYIALKEQTRTAHLWTSCAVKKNKVFRWKATIVNSVSNNGQKFRYD